MSFKQAFLIDIRNETTMQGAMNSHFGCDTFENIGYKCENCGGSTGTKQMKVTEKPMVLCLALKRFAQYDCGTREKSHNAIQIVENLNLCDES